MIVRVASVAIQLILGLTLAAVVLAGLLVGLLLLGAAFPA